MINAHERAAASMRYLQSITESASYMLIMGSIGGILFILLGYIAIKTYFDVADWIPIYSSRLQDFNKLKTYDMGRSFLDNKQIFSSSNFGEVFQRFELLIRFITSDIHYMDVKYSKIDLLNEKCFNLSMFTTIITLALNIPW